MCSPVWETLHPFTTIPVSQQISTVRKGARNVFQNMVAISGVVLTVLKYGFHHLLPARNPTNSREL